MQFFRSEKAADRCTMMYGLISMVMDIPGGVVW